MNDLEIMVAEAIARCDSPESAARAAIAAMMEPSEAMEVAGMMQAARYVRGIGTVVDIYRAMLGAVE